MIEIKTINDVVCVHGTPGGNKAGMSVYVFLTDGLLIDTGAQILLEELIPFYESADFDSVALTHYHEDHTGGAAWIQEHKKVPLFIHPMSVEVCAKDAEYPEYRKIFWGKRDAFIAEPLGKAIHSRTQTWEPIFTPGHAKDHMVYLNHNNGVLFSGDLFVTPKTKLVLREESVPVIIDSIKRLLQYDFGEVFCCHAGHVPDGKEMFLKKLDYLENLQGEILRLHSQGLTVHEIQQAVLPNRYPLIEISGHEWDSEHIITSILNENILSAREKGTI
ncbi:MBL fold metallo-hydrolase [Peribacillus frigoritolerans]|uniref:MBL fold metallo-hydrolase n=1 Tax=Peribacillus frigoritolerans TaxID=450367 RepID=UPI000BBA38ED|nr:MBL fold metallo-hydrolase [Peribacillus frigoritolerans]MCP1491174.1 glyoxylase-like metal-dependent hydrolase (beta-lactamase superfamily II) [Peribacillus frigoritolerans]PCD06501.1 MBL fold metallo-hydrolase [Peribacillus simplex]